MGKLFVCLISVAVSVLMIVQLYGCGTLIYPERRGQTTGTVDVGIALLDALWLIVFIIPGVVAFAVDFTTGAIYLPGGKRATGSSGKIVVVRVNPADLNEETIKEVVKRHTGHSELELRKAKIYQMDRSESVEAELSEIAKSGYQAH
ncbi:MAG: polyribonucleotide nucleotidyltransferase [Thermodesulfobacteriota bacterium]